jgi:hypothetical protein
MSPRVNVERLNVMLVAHGVRPGFMSHESRRKALTRIASPLGLLVQSVRIASSPSLKDVVVSQNRP